MFFRELEDQPDIVLPHHVTPFVIRFSIRNNAANCIEACKLNECRLAKFGMVGKEDETS